MLNSINNTSFTGTFIIKKPTEQQRNDLLEIAAKHKLVYQNFDGKNNDIYVIKDSRDKSVADYIIKENLKFKYYPELNTKSGFKTDNTKSAIKVLQENQTPIIDLKTSLIKHFVKLTSANESNSKDNYVKKTMNALNLDPTQHRIKYNGKFIKIYDQNKNLVASVSPTGKYGMNFATLESKNTDESPRRFALDQNGNIIVEYKSPSGIIQFHKNFKAAVEYSKTQNN